MFPMYRVGLPGDAPIRLFFDARYEASGARIVHMSLVYDNHR